jgi:DNA-binding transcriptional MocR family regulator
LTAGARLPPQRSLAEALGIDFTTVTRGYAEAERRGLVLGEPGRGTFVRAGDVAERARSAAGNVVDLSMNFPPQHDADLAATQLRDTLSGVTRLSDVYPLLAYQDTAGMESYRAAAARWLGSRGVVPDPSRVVLTCGAQHGLTVLLMILMKPDETVLTEVVTYPGFKALAESLHLRVVGLPLDDDGIDPDAFKKACRAGAKVLYVTPTLHNPTTLTWSQARRAAVARIAVSYGVRIIEDDVYGPLAAGAPAPLATFATENTYFVTSLTKAVAGGLRVGYVFSPSRAETGRVAAGVRMTTWMAAPLMAHIASDWIRSGVAKKLLESNRAEASRRQAVAKRALRTWDFKGARGSYHGWLTLPRGWSSAAFAAESRRRGVVVAPVDAFAVGTGAQAAVRLSLTAAADTGALEAALARLSELLEVGPRGAGDVM